MLVGSPVMYDIILFKNFRTRKREAGQSQLWGLFCKNLRF